MRDSCKPHFKSLGILTVYSIYILESAMYVKNNSNSFKTNGHHLYETRNRGGLQKVLHKTSKFEKSPYYSLVKIFENIPQNIKYLPVKSFKKELTSYLINKCFYSLEQFYDDSCG